MNDRRILYVCTRCADGAEESCGHYDRTELRVTPDGDWLCENCHGDIPVAYGDRPSWNDLPSPPLAVLSVDASDDRASLLLLTTHLMDVAKTTNDPWIKDLLAQTGRFLATPANAKPDRDSIRIAQQFVSSYRSGAQGASMDADSAMALALAIEDILG